MPEKFIEKPVEKSEGCAREERILAYWREKSIFERTLQKESPKGNWVFYDGPPYATGLPHFGHILPTTIKDVFPRYKTMQGYHVERKWGWDCHGLPIENLIEKKLDLKNKRDIEEYGIDKFNKAARESVLTYADEWRTIIPRLGRWVDMDNDYQTMDASFTESVWWSFKTLFEKGLVYEGFKSMHVCPRCATPVSNSEVSMGGYKDITDISVFVKLNLIDDPMAGAGVSFGDDVAMLAWTTTPWTLPGNVALAVNPTLDYVLIKTTDKNAVEHKLILAKERLSVLKQEYSIEREFKGTELVGKSYKPMFPYYVSAGSLPKNQELNRTNAWKIYAGDFVTNTDGTGIVHIASSFGEDDLNLALKHNLPIIQHIGIDGIMKPEVTDFAGMNVKPKSENSSDHQKTDIEVIKWMAKNGALFEKEKIIHSYPHCWRCDTPLLNYATNAWFIKTVSFRDRMVELNKTVKWLPEEIGEGRFGKWLENARDWNVSRSRYWGSPLPIWKNEKGDKIETIGSIDELRKKLNVRGNKFVFMRHGESESNVAEIINSSNDKKYSLTKRGIDQVEKSAEELKKTIAEKGLKVSRIYCSDLQRTEETAKIVAKVLGLSEDKIITDVRLHELEAGDFNGRPWVEYHNYFKTNTDKLLSKLPGGGESNADVKKRVAAFLYDVDSKHENELILAMTHGLPLHMAQEIARGKTNRDILRKGWHDVPEETGSYHWIDFVSLPHNDEYELDLHRPYIDNCVWKNADGETMTRVKDIFDVWYDSGAMPYAQIHYPFERTDEFLKKGSQFFPADFIAEGLDQTRGWFYSLMQLSTSLFDTVPFKNVVVNGLILAEDGKKMSKSLNNFPPLMQTVEKYSADSLRFLFAASSAVSAEELKFSEKNLDEVNKKVFMRLGNVVTFYMMYATESNATKGFDRPKKSVNILDKWIIARLDQLLSEVTTGLDNYELDRATRPMAQFVDDLSTWYLRRSRDRFKSDNLEDKQNALNTTSYVLYTLSKIMAPIAPFFAEDLYLRLTNHGAESVRRDERLESVHLEDWPSLNKADEQIISETSIVRQVVEKALALRSKSSMKVRQPLASITLAEGQFDLFKNKDYKEVLMDEINVKEVLFTKTANPDAVDGISVDTKLTPELIAEGQVRELTRAIQDLRKTSGLSAGDKILLKIYLSNDKNNFANVLQKFNSEISSTVNATEIKIVEKEVVESMSDDHNKMIGSQNVDVGENSVRVEIFK